MKSAELVALACISVACLLRLGEALQPVRRRSVHRGKKANWGYGIRRWGTYWKTPECAVNRVPIASTMRLGEVSSWLVVLLIMRHTDC